MEFFTPVPDSSVPPSFEGSTLLLPQPSLASLAQLATDLLIHNFDFIRVGFAGLRDHVPALSGLDTLPGQPARDGISYSVEVFQNSSRSLTIILPRTPVIRARRPNYLASLKDFIESSRFKDVLIIAGVDAALRGDDGLNSTTPLRYFSLPSSSPASFSQQVSSICPPYASNTSPTSIPLLPHGGLTRKLLETLSPTTSLPPVTALTIFTFDTTEPETAFYLADALLSIFSSQIQSSSQAAVEGKVRHLSLETEERQTEQSKRYEWKMPKSWENGLLGAGLDREAGTEMFG